MFLNSRLSSCPRGLVSSLRQLLGLQGDQTKSALKEINPEYSLEGLMLKLKLWAPDVKNQLIGKDWERLRAGGEGGNRG